MTSKSDRTDTDTHTDSGRADQMAADRSKDCVKHREDLLDEALTETFPASDPPSIARPVTKGC